MKNMNKQKDHVVLSLSGGLDSSTLLLRCLSEYKSVTCISFDYGQKHRVELERAQSLVDYINNNITQRINNIQIKDGIPEDKQSELDLDKMQNEWVKNMEKMNHITYRQIQLNGLVDLLDSTLVTGGDEVPEGHYAEENQRQTVVPNRNKIFASIVQAVALSVTTKTGENCDIALGIHSGDHSVYPDTTEEFRQADLHAFRVGNWDADKVGFFAPYMEGDKFTILQDGEMLCKELGLDFDEVYSRTNTSYKPILIEAPVYDNDLNIVAAPRWYSDYKSASSVERVEAFIKLGRKDPVGYADENGVVTWGLVVNEVTKVLETHNQ
jgi:7-cyano-7-deazaguanine synthase